MRLIRIARHGPEAMKSDASPHNAPDEQILYLNRSAFTHTNWDSIEEHYQPLGIKKGLQKIKDQIIIDFIDRHMSKFDRLMNNASKELETMGLGCSVHALSSQIVKHIATNMADYYGTTEKVKDTFQTALDEEVNHRYIHAKAEREEAYIK